MERAQAERRFLCSAHGTGDRGRKRENRSMVKTVSFPLSIVLVLVMMLWSCASPSSRTVMAARHHPREAARAKSNVTSMVPVRASGRITFKDSGKEKAMDELNDDLRKVPTGANPLHNR